MHSICFEHFVDVCNHLTCLSALDFLFGACWMALHVVGVSLFFEAGSAVSADWLLVHSSCGGRGLHAWLRPGRHLNLYVIFVNFCVFNVWTMVLTGSGTRSVILDFAGRWVSGRGPCGVVPGRLGGRSCEWMTAVLMFTYGKCMHVGHRSAVLCLLLTLLGFVLTLHWTGNYFINLTGNSNFILVNMSEELSCSRAACRGWVTQECKNLATTLEDPELNVVKLSAAID